MKLLEVKNLNVSFFDDDQEYRVLRDINFSVNEGEAFGIVGESGCGKSVTAYSILGLLPANARVISGEILYNGKDLVTFTDKQLTEFRGNEIAMVFQNPLMALNPVLTVGEQVAEAVLAHRKVSKKDAVNITISLFEELQFPEPKKVVKEYPHMLSGGMRQRVVIAIALACRPKILIADEATTALDVTVQRQVLDLIKQVCTNRDMSLIIVSHDLGVISYMAERVGVMYCGKFVELGELSEIISSPKHPYTKGLIAAIPRRGAELVTIKGTVPNVADWLAQGCMFYDRCKYADNACKKEFGYVRVSEAREVLCRKLDVI